MQTEYKIFLDGKEHSVPNFDKFVEGLKKIDHQAILIDLVQTYCAIKTVNIFQKMGLVDLVEKGSGIEEDHVRFVNRLKKLFPELDEEIKRQNML